MASVYLNKSLLKSRLTNGCRQKAMGLFAVGVEKSCEL